MVETDQTQIKALNSEEDNSLGNYFGISVVLPLPGRFFLFKKNQNISIWWKLKHKPRKN